MQDVARLPQLTELLLWISDAYETFVPLGLFSNLSKLSVEWDVNKDRSSFISEMATVIANSPRLRFLDVTYGRDAPNLTLSDLFAELPSNSLLCLEQLHISDIDATVDQVTLPHLMHLTTFHFYVSTRNLSVAQSVWNSLRVNNVKLLDVTVGTITRETMLYLSSFSGLKSLVMRSVVTPPEPTLENIKDILFSEVLSKHANSLQTLEIPTKKWVKPLLFLLHVTSSLTCRKQLFTPTTLKSILKCLKLRHLYVGIHENMTMVSYAITKPTFKDTM
jgi:hypothetical protein